MINCAAAENAEVVAICDIRPELPEKQKEKYPDLPIAYYTDFEAFIKHEMDAMVVKPIPPYTVAVGNPAKVIRKRRE